MKQFDYGGDLWMFSSVGVYVCVCVYWCVCVQQVHFYIFSTLISGTCRNDTGALVSFSLAVHLFKYPVMNPLFIRFVNHDIH